jgi:FlaA1/EpsC-like NDP-sugar epimerase
MKSKYTDKVKYVIGDIRDRFKIESTITRLDPHIIIIASALKHIDTCEYEVHESLETNTNGTLNVLRSIEHNIKRLKRLETVVFISTDKACYPINTYGICKALSEKAIVEYSLKMNQERVKFVNVRYGNVLNSRGSIIPKLKECKEDTLYLTHPDMTRFIMTQEDSVNLIQYAIMNGNSGDTIIPRIEAMRIKDLFELFAERHSPPKKIEITSLRPGEKMSEALLNINEIRRTICKDNYYIIKPDYKDNNNYEFIDLKSYDSSDKTLDKKELELYLKRCKFY